jgi:hypothetical protein
MWVHLRNRVASTTRHILMRKVFSMPKKGQQYTMMMDEVRLALVWYKKDHHGATQKELIKWLEDTHQLKVSQATVSGTLKRSTELFTKATTSNLSSKCQKTVKFPVMEAALVEWFLANQEHVNLSGDLIRESVMKIIDRLYPDHPPFKFSNGWLEAFKVRHGIKKHRRFGESGSIDMTTVAAAFSGIRQVLDAYEWRDIYNMDESGLFYCMQVHTVSSKIYHMSLSLAN